MGAIFSGVGWPGLNILFGKVVHSFVEYEKNRASHGNDSAEVEIITEEFRAETYLYGGIMAAITVLYIIGNYTAIHSFQMFALRLMREIKKRYFASILKQEIAWFDTQNSGEFASRISRYCGLFTFKKHQQRFHQLFLSLLVYSDFKKFESGINENLGLLIYNISCSLQNVVIGLVFGWKLSLVIIAMSPIIAVSSFGMTWVSGELKNTVNF